ncbi:MAG: hypothetical protein AAGE52_30760 [Myxococcota bacterium]
MFRVLLFLAIGCATSNEHDCIEEALFSKADLSGVWLHQAEIVDASTDLLGARMSAGRLRWDFDEFFVYMYENVEDVSGAEPALAFSVDAHLSRDHRGCVVDTELAWFEQNDIAVDLETEHVGRSIAPAGVLSWEPIALWGATADLAPEGEPAFEYDEAGRLERLVFSTIYLARGCPTCPVDYVTVEHVLAREP